MLGNKWQGAVQPKGGCFEKRASGRNAMAAPVQSVCRTHPAGALRQGGGTGWGQGGTDGLRQLAASSRIRWHRSRVRVPGGQGHNASKQAHGRARVAAASPHTGPVRREWLAGNSQSGAAQPAKVG